MAEAITTLELAEEMARRHNISGEAARQGVESYVNQLVDIDGEDATIAARRAKHNASGHWVRDDVTLTAADSTRESFADEYGDDHQ